MIRLPETRVCTGYSLRIEGKHVTGSIQLPLYSLGAAKGAARAWYDSTARGVRVSVVDSDGFVVWTLGDDTKEKP